MLRPDDASAFDRRVICLCPMPVPRRKWPSHHLEEIEQAVAEAASPIPIAGPVFGSGHTVSGYADLFETIDGSYIVMPWPNLGRAWWGSPVHLFDPRPPEPQGLERLPELRAAQIMSMLEVFRTSGLWRAEDALFRTSALVASAGYEERQALGLCHRAQELRDADPERMLPQDYALALARVAATAKADAPASRAIL